MAFRPHSLALRSHDEYLKDANEAVNKWSLDNDEGLASISILACRLANEENAADFVRSLSDVSSAATPSKSLSAPASPKSTLKLHRPFGVACTHLALHGLCRSHSPNPVLRKQLAVFLRVCDKCFGSLQEDDFDGADKAFNAIRRIVDRLARDELVEKVETLESEEDGATFYLGAYLSRCIEAVEKPSVSPHMFLPLLRVFETTLLPRMLLPGSALSPRDCFATLCDANFIWYRWNFAIQTATYCVHLSHATPAPIALDLQTDVMEFLMRTISKNEGTSVTKKTQMCSQMQVRCLEHELVTIAQKDREGEKLSDCYMRLGAHLEKAGQDATAQGPDGTKLSCIDCLVRSVQADASNPSGWNVLAQMARRNKMEKVFVLGKEFTPFECVVEVLKIVNFSDPWGWVQLDKIWPKDRKYIEINGEKMKLADCYAKAAELEPDQAWNWTNISWRLESSGDTVVVSGRTYTASEAALEALKRNIDARVAWNNLAFIMKPSEKVTIEGLPYSRFDCALKSLTIEGGRDSGPCWDTMGCVLGDADGSTGQPQTMELYGHHYDKLGCFIRALELTDDNHEMWENLAKYMGPDDKVRIRTDFFTKEDALKRAADLKPDKKDLMEE